MSPHCYSMHTSEQRAARPDAIIAGLLKSMCERSKAEKKMHLITQAHPHELLDAIQRHLAVDHVGDLVGEPADSKAAAD